MAAAYVSARLQLLLDRDAYSQLPDDILWQAALGGEVEFADVEFRQSAGLVGDPPGANEVVELTLDEFRHAVTGLVG